MRLSRVFCALVATLPIAAQSSAPLVLQVDARDISRYLLHAKLQVPVKAGPVTLVYPKWLPGEHGPTGPVTDLVGLKFRAGGKDLTWRRDDVDMYAFHVTVPAGATELEATYDFISPLDASGFSSGASATGSLGMLSWNQVVLYPEGRSSDAVSVQASLRMPEGWHFGSAMPVAQSAGDTVSFKPVSLTMLVDSPVLMSSHFRSVDLGSPQGIPHHLNMAGDTEQSLGVDELTVKHYQALVTETGALFGARHYAHYDFLVTLSDHVAHFGLEHHQSSDDRIGEKSMSEATNRRLASGLLPHEMVHSWNGKFRRPAGLATANYQDPMKGELLWVYEGLTQYLGWVLTARTGLASLPDSQDSLAFTAADMANTEGRNWRPIEDTAVAAQLLYAASGPYGNYRRSVDFYPEGLLIWLEADSLIRQKTAGKRSLDDFCSAFYGGPSGEVMMKPYTFDDVVGTLNTVMPYDWAGFLHARVNGISTKTPEQSLAACGWKLTYTAEPGDLEKAYDAESKGGVFAGYSLGTSFKADGTITDVHLGSPASKAGLAPSMKVIGVNGRLWSAEVFEEALKSKQPMELLVARDGVLKTHKVDYTGGPKHIHLERLAGTADLLTEILKPKVAAAK